MSDEDKGVEWPVRPAEADRPEASEDRGQTSTVVASSRSKRTFWPILAALGVLIALLLVLLLVAGRGNSDQDKLAGAADSQNLAAADDPSKLCASKQTYDLIKRELFRRAAQVRGSDQAAYGQLAAYATLRMENPVMENEDQLTGAVLCSGSLSLDLPPGVAVAGGRRTLHADIDYSIQRAADDSGNVLQLRNADAIVDPLATLTRIAQPARPPAQADQDATPVDTDTPDVPDQAPRNEDAEQPRAEGNASPSFNCANARSRSEIAVCSDNGLAALDRNMAAQYRRAISGASGDQKALLQQTRDRFLAYRDRCPNRSCIADAYTGRMREIRDIMEGRWQPRR